MFMVGGQTWLQGAGYISHPQKWTTLPWCRLSDKMQPLCAHSSAMWSSWLVFMLALKPQVFFYMKQKTAHSWSVFPYSQEHDKSWSHFPTCCSPAHLISLADVLSVLSVPSPTSGTQVLDNQILIRPWRHPFSIPLFLSGYHWWQLQWFISSLQQSSLRWRLTAMTVLTREGKFSAFNRGRASQRLCRWVSYVHVFWIWLKNGLTETLSRF